MCEMMEECFTDITEAKQQFGSDLAYEIIINWKKVILT